MTQLGNFPRIKKPQLKQMPENACNSWSKEHLKCYLWHAWLWRRDVVTCHQKHRHCKILSSIASLEINLKIIINNWIKKKKKMLTTEANWSKVYKLNPLCSHSHLCVWKTNIMVSRVPRNQNKATTKLSVKNVIQLSLCSTASFSKV